MRWTRRLEQLLRAVFRRYHAEQDPGEELRFHIERQTAHNVAAGMDRDEARFAALRQFWGPATANRS